MNDVTLKRGVILALCSLFFKINISIQGGESKRSPWGTGQPLRSDVCCVRVGIYVAKLCFSVCMTILCMT